MPFVTGQVANPKGRPIGAIGFQSWPTICNRISEDYGPDEIIELAAKVRSGKKVPLSTIKALAIQNVAAALQGEGKERERLLDRLLGKAVQRLGGETPGEPIKIAGRTIAVENMDTDSLIELAMALEKVKSKIIDAEYTEIKTAPPQLSNGADSDEAD